MRIDKHDDRKTVGGKNGGMTKNLNFDGRIDGGRGGGVQDGAMKAGRETSQSGCATAESKGRTEWLEKS